MKTTIDRGAVAAIAHAAIANLPRKFDYSNEWDKPEDAAWEPLGLEDLHYEAKSNSDCLRLAILLYRTGFAFALQLGARIGADPLHRPEIKDLIEQYRVELERAAKEVA